MLKKHDDILTIKELCSLLKTGKDSAYDLIHSATSNLISNGVSIVDVQHWLGHSQPSTTLNFYAHTDSNAKIRTGEMIEKSLTFEKIVNEFDD